MPPAPVERDTGRLWGKLLRSRFGGEKHLPPPLLRIAAIHWMAACGAEAGGKASLEPYPPASRWGRCNTLRFARQAGRSACAWQGPFCWRGSPRQPPGFVERSSPRPLCRSPAGESGPRLQPVPSCGAALSRLLPGGAVRGSRDRKDSIFCCLSLARPALPTWPTPAVPLPLIPPAETQLPCGLPAFLDFSLPQAQRRYTVSRYSCHTEK